MAVVIKIGTLIQKYADREEVKLYLESQECDWKDFVEGELRKSTELNTRSLGGQQPRHSMSDDDDDNNMYEMNMEKIMQRFSNFNSLVSSKSQSEEEEEEEKQDEPHRVEDDMFDHLQKDTVLEQRELVQEFTDSVFYKLELYSEDQLDALLAAEGM
mgnify:CR=1 FL=1